MLVFLYNKFINNFNPAPKKIIVNKVIIFIEVSIILISFIVYNTFGFLLSKDKIKDKVTAPLKDPHAHTTI